MCPIFIVITCLYSTFLKKTFYKSKVNFQISINNFVNTLMMSDSLLWRHIVLLTVGDYSSNHGVL